MPRVKHSMEQIIAKLRKADLMLSDGKNIDEVVKALQVNKLTYYRWKKEYGGMQTEQAKKLKDLEKENARLKKLVAELSLDKDILKEINKGNF